MSPVLVPLIPTPAVAQAPTNIAAEIERLQQQAKQQTQEEKPLEAIATLEQALNLARQIDDKPNQALALVGLGFNYNHIGRWQPALDAFNQALIIFQEVNDRSGEATTLNNIGLVYNRIGQPQKALEYYEQALPIQREVNDRSGEATTLNNIGLVYNRIGQPQKALEYYEQALPIQREVNDRSGEATTLNNIGLVYNRIGQPQKALEYYEQALPIQREVNDRSGEATTLNNIGLVYDSIGQPQKALEYYEQALPIQREVNDRSGEATTLSNMAAIYRDNQEPGKAIDLLQQSVAITLEIRGGLLQEQRQQFLEAERGPAVALVDLLIDQQEAARAFSWTNLATAADVIDYTRLVEAKVSNPEAQKLIDDWNQIYQEIQALNGQLETNPPNRDMISAQLKQLWEKTASWKRICCGGSQKLRNCSRRNRKIWRSCKPLSPLELWRFSPSC